VKNQDMNETVLDLCLRIWEVLEASPNSIMESLEEASLQVIPSLVAIVKYSDGEELIESALLLLACKISADPSQLARDKEFCVSLMTHLSAAIDIQSALTILMMIVDFREGLEVVVEHLDLLINLIVDEEYQDLKKLAISRSAISIEQLIQQSDDSPAFSQALRKLNQIKFM